MYAMTIESGNTGEFQRIERHLGDAIALLGAAAASAELNSALGYELTDEQRNRLLVMANQFDRLAVRTLEAAGVTIEEVDLFITGDEGDDEQRPAILVPGVVTEKGVTPDGADVETDEVLDDAHHLVDSVDQEVSPPSDKSGSPIDESGILNAPADELAVADDPAFDPDESKTSTNAQTKQHDKSLVVATDKITSLGDEVLEQTHAASWSEADDPDAQRNRIIESVKELRGIKLTPKYADVLTILINNVGVKFSTLDLSGLAGVEAKSQAAHSFVYGLLTKVKNGDVIDGHRFVVGESHGCAGRQVYFEGINEEGLDGQTQAAQEPTEALGGERINPDDVLVDTPNMGEMISDAHSHTLDKLSVPGVITSTVDRQIWDALVANSGTPLAPRAIAKGVKGIDQRTLKQAIPRFFDRLKKDSVYGSVCVFEKDGESKRYGIDLSLLAGFSPEIEIVAPEDIEAARPVLADAPPPQETTLSEPTPYTRLTDNEAALYQYFIDNPGVDVKVHELWTYAQDTGLELGNLHNLETLVAKLSKDPLLSSSFTVSGGGASKVTYRLNAPPKGIAGTQAAGQNSVENSAPTQTEPVEPEEPAASAPKPKPISSAASERQLDRIGHGAEVMGHIMANIMEGTPLPEGLGDLPLHTIRRALRDAEQHGGLDDEPTTQRYEIWQRHYDDVLGTARTRG